MDPEIASLIAFVAVIILIVLRVPIAFCLLAAGVLGIFLLEGGLTSWQILGRYPYEPASRYVLIVIPFFLAMGAFVQQGSIGSGVFGLANRLLRGVPGGLAVGTVLACSVFAAITGSSLATIASVGRVAVLEMRRYGYSDSVAAGVVAASGTLGVIIPPSIALILYGILTGESIGELLIAGIVPGILSAAMYGGMLIIRARRSPELFGHAVRSDGSNPRVLQHVSKASAKETVGNPDIVEDGRPGGSFSTLPVIGAVALFCVVIGSIYFGIATVIEASAVGALGAFLLMVVEPRAKGGPSRWHIIVKGLQDTIQVNSMVFMLLIGAGIFTLFLTMARVPVTVTELVMGLEVSPVLILVLLVLAFVPLGMFLDPISMMLITVPLVYPAVTAAGFDGIWFGIIVIKMIELALISPPLGMNAFVVSGSVEGVSAESVFRGAAWYIPIDLATVVLLFLFPSIVTWLPNQMGL